MAAASTRRDVSDHRSSDARTVGWHDARDEPDVGRRDLEAAGRPVSWAGWSGPGSLRLVTSRLLKKPASCVLASLEGSTYRTTYALPSRSLRPCWRVF